MTKTISQSHSNLKAYSLSSLSLQTLELKSEVLENNPLQDSATRYHSLLLPQNRPEPWPVVLVLAGFSSNGPFALNPRFNELNSAQVLDQAVASGQAPEALYCFVDALTTWGGSQFINSPATGQYEDMIITELVPELKKHFNLSSDPGQWCVMGGSSGGYGALNLGTKYPHVFGKIAAIAPDCFFEASLLPDLYLALPYWKSSGESSLQVLKDLRSGKLMKQKNSHSLLNAFGMAACYGATGKGVDFLFPLDSRTGLKIPELWQRWQTFDPVYFLQERSDALKKLEGVFLDVGTRDNFHLQYGARQVSDILKNYGIQYQYQEFEGTHFDIGERRIEVWKWLASAWR